jgi:hypothetical protein
MCCYQSLPAKGYISQNLTITQQYEYVFAYILNVYMYVCVYIYLVIFKNYLKQNYVHK